MPEQPAPAAGLRGRRPVRARTGVRAAFAALSFVTLVGSGLAWAQFRNFSDSIPHGAPVPPLRAGQTDPDGKDQNILLIGSDSRAGATKAELRALSTGDPGDLANSDTMMVLHVPANGSKPTIVSFPRDSWVDIPGNGKGKINAAYSYGYHAAKNAHKSERAAQSAGIISSIKTITALTGLHIDHYVQVNLLGFYRISKAIGGVKVCLLAAQNPRTDSDEFGSGYSGINLPKGVSVIQGKQALAFVRQRHGLPHGDLDRIKRQQYFLAAAFSKVTSAGVVLNPFKLNDLLDAVGSSLLIDPDLDIMSLARQFQTISGGNIKFATIPNNGPQVIYPDGVETAIVGVDRGAIPEFIRELQGKGSGSAYKAARPARRATVTVDVLNGTPIVGLAGRNAERLKTLGFKVNVVDSTDSSNQTVIKYRSGQESQAKAVAAVLPRAKLVQTATVPRVTVILGTNGVLVSGVASDGGAQSQAAGTPQQQVAEPQRQPRPQAGSRASSTKSARSPEPGLGCIN